QNLLDQGAIIAAKAQENRWIAAKAAADAANASTEAQKAASEAQKSAAQAKQYAAEADKSATQAEKSAAKAANSASTARSAADAADHDAADAEESAADSDFSAQYARDSADEARIYADDAHRSALKAGKSEKEANQLAAAAWKDVITKRQAELDAERKKAAELRKKQREQQQKKTCIIPMNRELTPCQFAPDRYNIEMPAIDPTINRIFWKYSGLDDLKGCIKNPTWGQCIGAGAAVAMVIPPFGAEAGGGVEAVEGVEDIVRATRIGKNATGTVWDGIKATQPTYPGTKLPRSFELTAGDTQVWVHGNASEHIAEYLSGMAKRGAGQFELDMATQVQLTNLQTAVEKAGRGGLPFDKMVVVDGWELKFGAPRSPGQLPALIHALPRQ
ncbi:hypothetical protein AB0L16_26905, partial [Streptomyces orinoci]